MAHFFHVSGGLYGSGGSDGYVADIPKSPGFPNANQAPFLGRTSTWSGYSVLGIPNDGSSSYGGAAPGEIIPASFQGGNHILTDDEVKDLVITGLDPALDHTLAP